MTTAKIWIAVLGAHLAMSALAFAVPITVHNTGTGPSGVVAPGGQSSFWTLSIRPSGASQPIGSNPFRYAHPVYFADTASAAWVSPQANGDAGAVGAYVYDLVIDLTDLDPTTASISGVFGTDNSGAIWLNDNAPVATTASQDFYTPTAFTINSGFTKGLNTIHVQMNNEGDPTAFFVSFSSASAQRPPQPVPAIGWGAMALLALVLAGTGSLLTRKR